jgi:hypothetical protein
VSVCACCVQDPGGVTAPGLGISVPSLELPFLGRHTSDVCNVYCTEAGDLVFCRTPGLLYFMLLYPPAPSKTFPLTFPFAWCHAGLCGPRTYGLSYAYFRGALVVQRECISDMLPEA